MIINGEKVPAFTATTLSIPTTPKDNFSAIITSSRLKYSRPRADVEAEIRETIEQSEKYKKNLSDSGRAAGEQANNQQRSVSVHGHQGSTSGAPVSKADFVFLGYTDIKEAFRKSSCKMLKSCTIFHGSSYGAYS